MTDSEYLLGFIDETFAAVPEVKAHHTRIRRIAAALAHTQRPAAAQAKSEAVALRRYLSDTLQEGAASEKTVARTALRLLDSVAAPQQEAERQPLTTGQFYRHVKTGGVYEFVCRAIDESAPDVARVIYRSLSTGVLWDRTAGEFYDGRFMLITGPATQETKHG